MFESSGSRGFLRGRRIGRPVVWMSIPISDALASPGWCNPVGYE